jgi:hypothetical protein
VYQIKPRGLKLKNTAYFRNNHILLITLLLACTVFFASCGENSSSSSVATPTATPTTPITPIGAATACLTVNSPSLSKLADGNYQLVDTIDNCGDKDAGPLKIAVQIDARATKLETSLLGPATIPAHGKVAYHNFTGQANGANKEIHFPVPVPAFATVTISVLINGAVQGEWDGQVAIPA